MRRCGTILDNFCRWVTMAFLITASFSSWLVRGFGGALTKTSSRRSGSSSGTYCSGPWTTMTSRSSSSSRRQPPSLFLVPQQRRLDWSREHGFRHNSSHSDDSATTTTTTTTTTTVTNPMLSQFDASAYELPAFPDVVTDLVPGQRILAIGDVHGDLAALKRFLVVAGVVEEEREEWIGGTALLVQCGDVLDRGDDELACFRLLAKLARQAQQSGGGVILLYGNHEALNAVGMFDYALPGGDQEIERDVGTVLDDDQTSSHKSWRLPYANHRPARWAAFEPGGLLSYSLLRQFKVATVVGKTVFVHAGLCQEHLDQYQGSLYKLNEAATEWIQDYYNSQSLQQLQQSPLNTVDQVLAAANARLRRQADTMPACLGGNSASGLPAPVWMRDYSQPPDRPPQSAARAQGQIDEVLTGLTRSHKKEVQRMVMGHTPQRQINAALQGKAWRIDVGASRGVRGGTPEVLEIRHGGDDQEDEIHILTADGQRVQANDRQAMEYVDLF